MIRPDIVSELEWQQHREWESFRRLLASRVESLMSQNDQLRDRLTFLQNAAVEATDGRLTKLTNFRREGTR